MTTPHTEDTDTLDSLDNLLTESLDTVRAGEEARGARERLRRGGQSTAERAEDAARIAAWEAAHEWSPVANVGVFMHTVCACGRRGEEFLSSLMVRETHRTQKFTQRWRAVSAWTNPRLQKEVMSKELPILACGGCFRGEEWTNPEALRIINQATSQENLP